jgi:DNA-binding beta-propeller fold protein YncE
MVRDWDRRTPKNFRFTAKFPKIITHDKRFKMYGQFNGPIDVATDSAGYVYVADSGNNRIQKFLLANPCPAGTQQVVSGVCFVTTWGSQGSGNGQFNHPSGVAVASSGRVYVSDQSNHRIQEFRWVADVGGGTTGGGNQPGAVK